MTEDIAITYENVRSKKSWPTHDYKEETKRLKQEEKKIKKEGEKGGKSKKQNG